MVFIRRCDFKKKDHYTEHRPGTHKCFSPIEPREYTNEFLKALSTTKSQNQLFY